MDLFLILKPFLTIKCQKRLKILSWKMKLFARLNKSSQRNSDWLHCCQNSAQSPIINLSTCGVIKVSCVIIKDLYCKPVKENVIMITVIRIYAWDIVIITDYAIIILKFGSSYRSSVTGTYENMWSFWRGKWHFWSRIGGRWSR